MDHMLVCAPFSSGVITPIVRETSPECALRIIIRICITFHSHMEYHFVCCHHPASNPISSNRSVNTPTLGVRTAEYLYNDAFLRFEMCDCKCVCVRKRVREAVESISVMKITKYNRFSLCQCAESFPHEADAYMRMLQPLCV